ncbi:MAG: undecaprenyl/decaprenyl-phosphate alpha-N-acetylglucosaminyl 1-phosphate transferase, partial [Streptomyces sp.]|nr:undecaprenyl/decaprenyl-phosphate alpha-N-acetylglucosaminyl 1-phosphate transferase [Streptomyces sp.]
SHSRAVLILYFWSALIAFGALAYSVNSASMWIVLGIVILCAIGLLLLLLPRFTPRAPRWAEHFVPPRYRRRRAVAETASTPAHPAAVEEEQRPPVVAGVAGVNGATALGARPRFLERRKAGTTR